MLQSLQLEMEFLRKVEVVVSHGGLFVKYRDLGVKPHGARLGMRKVVYRLERAPCAYPRSW